MFWRPRSHSIPNIIVSHPLYRLLSNEYGTVGVSSLGRNDIPFRDCETPCYGEFKHESGSVVDKLSTVRGVSVMTLFFIDHLTY